MIQLQMNTLMKRDIQLKLFLKRGSILKALRFQKKSYLVGVEAIIFSLFSLFQYSKVVVS